MILSIVNFKLPKRWTVAEATATFNLTAAKYFRKPGLVRKHYYISENGDRAGGIYFWRSKADAEACYTLEWKNIVTEQYGTSPEIFFAEVPVSVDNIEEMIELA